MYRPMRRKDRAMPPEEAWQLLKTAEYGVLSTAGADGQPYGVPLSFVVVGQALYFHCALQGQKIDNLAHEPRASFCVVGKTQPVYDNSFTTNFESAVACGSIAKVEEPRERNDALLALCEKYLPQHMDKAPGEIAHSGAVTAVYKMTLDHVTGKARRPRESKDTD